MTQRRPDRTLGPGHDTFWAHCAEDELWLQRCGACRRFSWPVTGACEHCGSTDLAFERLSGRAALVSRCTFERRYYGDLLPVPWECVLVELEEGPLFVSNPHDLAPDALEIGMAMQLAFIDCEDRHGAFRLPVFGRAPGRPSHPRQGERMQSPPAPDDDAPGRVALRRDAHELNDALERLLDRLPPADAEAAGCIRQARAALFEAWTLLCTPPEEEEDP